MLCDWAPRFLSFASSLIYLLATFTYIQIPIATYSLSLTLARLVVCPRTYTHTYDRERSREIATMPRTASLNRDTNETKIQVSINLDGGELPPFESSPFWDAHDKKNGNGETECVFPSFLPSFPGIFPSSCYTHLTTPATQPNPQPPNP